MKHLLTILALLAAAASASAIVVADYATATNSPSGINGFNWDYVYNYKGSSAVAVGSHWLLTAAHVADDGGTGTIVVNGTNCYQKEVIFHLPQDDSQHTARADLALVRFDKEFPDYYPLYTGTFPAQTFLKDKRLDAVLIGYGVTGTVYSTYYTMAAWNVSPNGHGVKRWGSQKIDGPDNESYTLPSMTVDTVNVGMKMTFVSNDTPYEAGVATYDSGGGTFVDDGGTWKLAGINTTIYRTSGLTPTNGVDMMFAVSVPDYATWVTNVMNPMGDLDGDGIPNYWEQRYGTTTGLVASADTDNDKFSNYQEYIADTNPTNAASFFEMSGFLASTNPTVYFTGSTGREYQIFYTTNDLADSNLTWSAAHTNLVWGTGTNTAITVTNVADKAFYRLKAILP